MIYLGGDATEDKNKKETNQKSGFNLAAPLVR